ncbi:membrane integrity-associated transporter subunit PqiC [Pseudacidovorax intermedius]|uniref:PqiC family protein n=1 Tax=Pseudacidovorax intermedius TaxID=433924 RepID=UPI001B2D7597|nr:PqiC family protein [Pseudacidovorax intermedius]MBO9646847.1 membrane integrity-associated transporter subunit PqiC [Pseudacidovorax sp.]
MSRFASRRIGATAVLALAMAGLGGCASEPDRYYTLAEPAAPQPLVAPPPGGLAIEMAPLAVPERLARPQMVVRGPAGAEVQVLEQSRWAASFEQELRDALAGGVAARLGATDATRGPGVAGVLPWRIAVQVQRFDAAQGGQVEAALSWTVRRADSSQRSTCSWRGSEAAPGGIDGVAQAGQRIVSKVSDAIARHIAALQAGQPAACPAAPG